MFRSGGLVVMLNLCVCVDALGLVFMFLVMFVCAVWMCGVLFGTCYVLCANSVVMICTFLCFVFVWFYCVAFLIGF